MSLSASSPLTAPPDSEAGPHAALLVAPLPAMQILGRVALSLLGCAAFGAASGIGHGAGAIVRGMWLSPTLFVGGALLALPPLYLLAALFRSRISAGAVVERVTAALSGVSLVLFGLAAPAALFSATLKTAAGQMLACGTVGLVGAVGIAAAAVATSQHDLDDRGKLVAGIWAIFALVLGLRLMISLGRPLLDGGCP